MNRRAIVNIALTVAAIGIVLFLLQVILMGGWMMSAVMGLGNIVVLILVPIYFVRRERERLGGVMSFGQIFGMVFLGLALAGIISTVFTYLYVQFIDAEYVGRLVNSTLSSTKSFMDGKVGDEQMREVLAKTEEGIVDGFALPGLLKSFGIGLAVYAAYAVILGFAMRKKPTNHDTLDDTSAVVQSTDI